LWAIGQLRTEHASIAWRARQFGTTWRTLWRAIEPLLQAMADDPTRFDDVTTLGVDEHLWHVSQQTRGPKALTGIVDLTCGGRARLLDLVPGRSGRAYADWLTERGDAFLRRVQVATLAPSMATRTPSTDQLQVATAVARSTS
jgi:transposase